MIIGFRWKLHFKYCRRVPKKALSAFFIIIKIRYERETICAVTAKKGSPMKAATIHNFTA